MQVIWEDNDIIAGRIYGKKSIKEKWIIGYRSDLLTPGRYVSISLSDGCVTSPLTKESFADMLTRNKYLPQEVLELLID